MPRKYRKVNAITPENEVRLVKFLTRNEEKLAEMTLSEAYDLFFDETFIKVGMETFEKIANHYMIKFKLDLRLNKQSIHRTDRIKSLALIVCAMFEELEDYLKQVNGTTVIFGENYCIRETLLQIASGLKTFPAGKVANTELEEQATEKPEQPQIGTKVQ